MIRPLRQSTRPECSPPGARLRFVLHCALACSIAFVAAVMCPAGNAAAQETPADLEQRVKAAFLYQFAAYVEWPPTAFAYPDTPVTIGVLAADGLAAELEKMIVGRTVSGRPVAVRRLKAGEPLAGLHILFIGGPERGRLSQLARPGPAVLTVTESDGALAQGSVINFIMVDRRVRFEIALDAAEKSGLRLSSRLLAVAQDVRGGAR